MLNIRGKHISNRLFKNLLGVKGKSVFKQSWNVDKVAFVYGSLMKQMKFNVDQFWVISYDCYQVDKERNSGWL